MAVDEQREQRGGGVGYFHGWSGEPPQGDALARLQFHKEALLREEHRVTDLFAELVDHPAGRALLLIFNSERFRSWSLAALLSDTARAQRVTDPQWGRELAGLAVAVASRLEAPFPAEDLIEDLCGRAWATLAEAERLTGEAAAAELAFRLAEEHLSKGTGDPQETAVAAELWASLRAEQRRHADARALLGRARTLYSRIGDQDGVGGTWVREAAAWGCEGAWDRALCLVDRGLEMLGDQAEPLVEVQAWGLRSFLLERRGRSLEAAGAAVEGRRLLRLAARTAAPLPSWEELAPQGSAAHLVWPRLL